MVWSEWSFHREVGGHTAAGSLILTPKSLQPEAAIVLFFWSLMAVETLPRVMMDADFPGFRKSQRRA